MKKQIGLLMAAAMLITIMGCAGANKNDKTTQTESNKKIAEMNKISEDIAGKTDYNAIKTMSAPDAAVLKMKLERFIKLGSEVRSVKASEHHIHQKNKSEFKSWHESAAIMLTNVNVRLNALNALDANGQLKPEFQPAKPIK